MNTPISLFCSFFKLKSLTFGLSLISVLVVSACSKEPEEKTRTHNEPIEKAQIIESQEQRLDRILSEQSDELKARYSWRHPKETIDFFGLQPGMSVVEVLPGGGWYSQILAPYLGQEGRLIGADYSAAIWPFFDWASEEFIAKRKEWPQKWSSDVSTWAVSDAPQAIGTNLGAMGPYYDGQIDAVLFIRALHNMHKLKPEQSFYDDALALSFRLLKPGGVVGVVQHQAPADKSLAWANGSRGYMNKEQLIQDFEKAGFVKLAESKINENPADQPEDDDNVWRLPPSFYSSANDEALKQAYSDIGESNRMTLLFKKPK
ncbi:class I SAM-dependent methyltransferase [Agaribacterium sp. ZY112]|uniref:class I SAM-dependent methyltransferase n=1 Tax=Agaribacterium sp. ZY112 TaxID=3233574 RepID=UPI0035237567